MINKDIKKLVDGSSAIRAMFEEGAKLIKKYGRDNVFDFSLGNPSVPAPDEIKDAVIRTLEEEDSTFVHGYMSNAGYEDVRQKIADKLNGLHGTAFNAKNIVMTVGAAGGLNVIFRTLLEDGDEIIAFAPFFGEYINYASLYNASVKAVPANTDTFQPDPAELEKCITEKTKAVIVNTPNNPTGVVYSEDTIRKIAEVLERKQKETGRPVYLIADEPYRELVYDGVEVPYLTKYYANTIVAYSYSKSLSLPGERIGYLVIPDEAEDSQDIIDGAGVVTRVMGFVNAPSLMQRVVMRCVDAETDVDAYDRNRADIYNGLTEIGFECVKPQGAFYLFMKSPLEDDKAFCGMAKKYNLLLVPGSSFACPGYVRLAYCVDNDMIKRSMPQFRKLMEEIKAL